jgi:DNA-directed RNA polymerase specialized sigma24 family protein
VNTIALNEFRRTLRQSRRWEALEDMANPTTGLECANVDIAKILNRCPPRDRMLLQAQLSGLTAKELSDRTGTTPTAMRLRLFRARRAARAVAMAQPSERGRPETARAA